MSLSTPQGASSYPSNNSSGQERNYDLSVQRQIEEEELKYKAAIQADKIFEEVKAIREKINHLKRLLK